MVTAGALTGSALPVALEVSTRVSVSSDPVDTGSGFSPLTSQRTCCGSVPGTLLQVPVQPVCSTLPDRIAEEAVIAWSGPACFWSSPSARVSAMRALALATSMASERDEVRSEIALMPRSPTEIVTSSTIRLREMTSAKPRACGVADGLRIIFGIGFHKVAGSWSHRRFSRNTTSNVYTSEKRARHVCASII